jgi:predicted AlkP superfamily phosphohydrolase/phosphomutase
MIPSDTRQRLLVIGLDAATFALIKPWVQEGRLPNLARLMAEGASGDLRSVPNLNSIPAWTTFSTGVNPGKHGLFWFYERRRQGYGWRFLTGADMHLPRFWDYASAAGLRVATINVPMTYPARPVNGLWISGLDAPDEESPGFTYPPELYRALTQTVGPYAIDANILGYGRAGRWDLAIRATEEVLRERLAVACHLLAREPWDAFVVVFTELDRVQHTFWRAMDPRSADYSPEEHVRHGDAIQRFYSLLDEAVGKLCALAGPEVTTVVVSDHGMGPNQRGSLYLQPWLSSLGYLTPRSQGGLGRRLLREAAHVADGLISKRLRRRIIRALPGGRAALVRSLHEPACDWSQTRAYDDYIRPCIWINLQGREPQGIVKPGAEYEDLRDELIDRLCAVRDLHTGLPVVNGVYRREEVYYGPEVQRSPDLIIDWNYEVIVSGYRSTLPDGREVVIDRPADVVERRNISGDHRPEGILILAGPGVRCGQTISGAQIGDVAPTLLYLLGLPVPEMMDGRARLDALDPALVAARPLRMQAQEAAPVVGERTLSDEEEDQVLRRLRDLGYVD